MKLLTLNTHSIIEPNYLHACNIFADAVCEQKPDIIALQEVNQTAKEKTLSPPPNFCVCGSVPVKADNHALIIYELLKKRGLPYNCLWAGVKKGYEKFDEGLAILSLAPIDDGKLCYISKSHDFENWRTRGALISKIGKFTVCSLHMGWWDDKKEPFFSQWQNLKNLLSPHENVLLMGDFNSPAHRENEGFDLVLNSGFFDTFMLSKSKDEGYTVRGKIAGWEEKPAGLLQRIDYIFTNKPLFVKSSRVIFNGNNYSTVSDHFGVLAEIEEE